jgi:hypothetical protein
VAVGGPRDRPVRVGDRRVRGRRRDAKAARRFFQQAIGTTNMVPVEVTTDRAATYPIVLEELLPAPWHRTEQYANNRVEADHGRLKSRLRPMRGLKIGPQRQGRDRRACLGPERSARVLRAGCRGAGARQLAVAFAELAMAF